MRNIFRDTFESLPESQQHLVKSAGAGSACVAIAVYGTFKSRPRPEGYDRAIEAAADGLTAANTAIMSLGGAIAFAHIAHTEFEAFQLARHTEQAQT